MSVGTRHASGVSGLGAIQALMCQLGADPPGYFAAVPRQPIKHSVHDPSLPAAARILEFMRLHTVCYEGVPKNAKGEPQFSPFCVGEDGKRLNQRDCARETGLSTSVVKRTFDTLRGAGYTDIKKDGSIWYCGKVERRAAAVRLSISEYLQARWQQSGEPAQPVLQTLVAGRVIAATLIKAAGAFPVDDQTAVEAHMLEVARWQRAEVARRIALVRKEAEQRYQAPSWHGYRLGKVGHTWARVPAHDGLFAAAQNAGSAFPDPTRCLAAHLCGSSTPLPKSENQSPDQEKGARPPEVAAVDTTEEFFACADGPNKREIRQAKGAADPRNKWSSSAPCRTRTIPEAAAEPIPAGAATTHPGAIAARQNTFAVRDDLLRCVPENLFVNSSPRPPEPQISEHQQNLGVLEAALPNTGVRSEAPANYLNREDSRDTEPEVATSVVSGTSSVSGSCATTGVLEAVAEPKPVTAYAEYIRRVFAGTGKGVPTDGQIGAALAYLPQQATPTGFASFILGKLPGIRHAGALVTLAQEYAYELQYQPPATVFQCVKCHDEGFVLPGGQYCECGVGLRRRKADEHAYRAGP